MLRPGKIPAGKERSIPLTRERIIKLLESRGVRDVEGKRLQECYTFELRLLALHGKSGDGDIP